MEASIFNEKLLKIMYDKSVVADLYEEYVDPVTMHVSWRFGGAVDAEDIAHEVFMKLMTIDWSKYKPVESPSAWLNSIADHLVLDKIKSKHIEYPIEDFENYFSYFELDKIMVADDVKTALNHLDKRDAYIIYMNKYEGYTFEDIAKQLSMKPGAVRTAASRAYKKLKKFCNKMFP